jgi:hypothetical protein
MDVIARISKNVSFPDAAEQVKGARYQDFPVVPAPVCTSTCTR